MKILISRCLLGEPCRYDGQCKAGIQNELLRVGIKETDYVSTCPECEGGLPTPRSPSEISEGTALEVLANQGRVIAKNGNDNTAAFLKGASIALERCLDNNIKVALLKSKSPSCGSGLIYDGTFSGQLIPGNGVTTELLRKHGILVLNETQIELLSAYLKTDKSSDC